MKNEKHIGLQMGTVRLVAHDKKWHEIATLSIAEVKNAIGEIAVDIQHVGSTSVKNIYAKPIIDLAVGLADKDIILQDKYLSALEKAGYLHNAKHDNDGKIFFYKTYKNMITHHVHVVNYKESAWNSYVNMRDYLNSDNEMALRYQNIKLTAENECENDIDKYYNDKADILREINIKAKEFTNQ